MLSHGSVTLRTSPQPSGGLKQKRKRMRQAAGPSPSCARCLGRGLGSRRRCGDARHGPAAARGCAVPALPARLLLLLLLLRPPLTPGTTCPTPTSVEHAEIRVKSYSVSSRERYVCNSGFKRKAGTSTLTECVLNKTTNVAHWTTPSLKCIRDPTLAHQKPVPPSTVVTPRVTPEPKSPSPPGKEFPTEPEALPPKPNTTVASETAIVPGSRLIPSQLPSAGTTETGSHEFSQVPSDTTAKTLESTTSTSPRIPGLSPHSSKMMTVAISTPAVLGFVVFVVLLTWYLRQRQTSQLPGIEMETMEAVPMTVSEDRQERGRHGNLIT